MPVTHVEDRFRVLFVCTANLCRSPMAQFLLDSAVRSAWPSHPDPWQVHSAGTNAQEGPDMDPLAHRILDERKVPVGPFVRTPLQPELIAAADLVLTAGIEHRATVVRALPKAAGHAFTVRQFGLLCADVPAAPPGMTPAAAGRWLLEQARSRRGHQGLINPSTYELADPIGAGPRAFRRCADTLQTVNDQMLAPVRPRP